MKEKSIEELIKDETIIRIREMEKPGYRYPKRLGRGDWLGIILGIAGSLALIAACMTGIVR